MHSEHDESSGEPFGAAPSSDDISPDALADTSAAANDDIPQLGVEDIVGDEHSVPEPEVAAPSASEPAVAAEHDDETDGAAAALSPAVRRLVRQYDLDITGIHGTGPSGRIKVGDVIALLGGRADAAPPRTSDAPRAALFKDEAAGERTRPAPGDAATPSSTRAPVPAAAGRVATTLFECDLTRALAHRKQLAERKVEIALTSYYVVACREALRAVPEIAGGRTPFGAALSTPEGQVHNVVVELDDDSALGSIDDRLLACDRALRARDAGTDLERAGLVLHHHGLAGSLFASPTPILESHTASIGLGRVRKQIVVRTVDGEDAPRVGALVYVTLSFLENRLDLARANRFLAQFVRVLEHWPIA